MYVYVHACDCLPVCLLLHFRIFFVKRLSSEVMVSFTYCDVHRCYCSKLLLASWVIKPTTLLEKVNIDEAITETLVNVRKQDSFLSQ